MRVYLDVCCLNRPFDDQSQVRIRFESEAIALVFGMLAAGQHTWVSSEVVEDEVLRSPHEDRRVWILDLLQQADERLAIGDACVRFAQSLAARGLSAMDALHVAAAETGGCDILLTTDDALLRKARALQPPLRVRIENPVRWVAEALRP